jgi:antitoxin component YwqK of YwqJK toxin-antitoxin module
LFFSFFEISNCTAYPDRTLKSLTEYKNGKINGKVYKYYQSGCPQETGIWVSTAIRDTLKTYKDGKDNCGTVIKRVWYKNNQRVEDNTVIVPKIKPDPGKKLTGEEIMSDQVIKDGYQKVYDSKRRILMDGTFKDGKLQSGKWYRYDGKGALTNIEIWKDGKYVEDAPLDNIPGHNE